jgi:hypothetical protein
LDPVQCPILALGISFLNYGILAMKIDWYVHTN